MWRDVQQRPQLSHIFTIGCDAHGLQLLVKDLLSLPSIDSVFKKAQSIVTHFNHSPLQLSILREIQMEEYGQEKSLLASVITRWGTQYTMMQSLKRSEAALSRFATRSDIAISDSLKETLQDDIFWSHLGKLLSVFKPINEAIRMSESTTSDISKVLNRWLSINRHLIDCQRVKPFEEDLCKFNMTTFHQRLGKQVSDIHWAIFYLNPVNCNLKMPPALQTRVNNVIRQYCLDPQAALEEFTSFRAKDGSFFQASCWEYTDNLVLFWKMQVSALYQLQVTLTKDYIAISVRSFESPI